MTASTLDSFVQDSFYAKVVKTPSGDGILIGGHVYMVTGPHISLGQPSAASLFVEALRMASGYAGELAFGQAIGDAATALKEREKTTA